jgi:hypothetical protein
MLNRKTGRGGSSATVVNFALRRVRNWNKKRTEFFRKIIIAFHHLDDMVDHAEVDGELRTKLLHHLVFILKRDIEAICIDIRPAIQKIMLGVDNPDGVLNSTDTVGCSEGPAVLDNPIQLVLVRGCFCKGSCKATRSYVQIRSHEHTLENIKQPSSIGEPDFAIFMLKSFKQA